MEEGGKKKNVSGCVCVIEDGREKRPRGCDLDGDMEVHGAATGWRMEGALLVWKRRGGVGMRDSGQEIGEILHR